MADIDLKETGIKRSIWLNTPFVRHKKADTGSQYRLSKVVLRALR